MSSDFEYLFDSEPLIEANVTCPDCGAEMRHMSGKFGCFYGCSQYRVTGCKGSVTAYRDGSLRGTPANAETRKARFNAMQTIERVRDQIPAERRREITAEMMATYNVDAVGHMNVEQANAIRFKYEYEVGERTSYSRLLDD